MQFFDPEKINQANSSHIRPDSLVGKSIGPVAPRHIIHLIEFQARYFSGDRMEAHKALGRSLRLAADLTVRPDPDVASVFLTAANFWAKECEFEKAEHFLQVARTVYSEQTEDQIFNELRLNLAEARIEDGQFSSMIEYGILLPELSSYIEVVRDKPCKEQDLIFLTEETLRLADLHLERRNLNAARGNFETALEFSRSRLGDHHFMTDYAGICFATLNMQSGHYKKAIAKLQKVAASLQDKGVVSSQICIHTQNMLSTCYYAMRSPNLDKAAAHARKARYFVSKLPTVDLGSFLSVANRSLSIEAARANKKSAPAQERIIRELYALAEKTPHHQEILDNPNIRMYLSIAQKRMQRPEEALKNVEYFLEQIDSPAAYYNAQTLGALELAYECCDDLELYPKAYSYSCAMTELAEKLYPGSVNRPLKARLYSNRVSVAFGLSVYEDVLCYAPLALGHLENASFPRKHLLECLNTQLLAITAANIGDLKHAELCYSKFISLLENQGDSCLRDDMSLIVGYLGLASLPVRDKHPDVKALQRATDYANKAEACIESMARGKGNTFEESNFYKRTKAAIDLIYGQMLIRRKSYDLAHKFLSKARDMSAEVDGKDGFSIAVVDYSLGELHLENRAIEESLLYFANSNEIFQNYGARNLRYLSGLQISSSLLNSLDRQTEAAQLEQTAAEVRQYLEQLPKIQLPGKYLAL